MRVRVCFVCLGNICRSPTAEGIFRHLVREAGLDESFEIDSAGTAAHHQRWFLLWSATMMPQPALEAPYVLRNAMEMSEKGYDKKVTGLIN